VSSYTNLEAAMTKQRRTAIYCRVSTSDQDIGLQQDELRGLVAQRGWTLAGEYLDDGVSGARTSRPGLDALLADAQAGRLDVVLVWRLDRLGRSLQHLLQVLDDLEGWGVGFVSAREPGLDSTSTTGKLLLQLIAVFASYERTVIQERVVAGIRRAQAAGTHCGRPRREIDLRPALAMFGQGHGIKATARSLGVSVTTLRRRLVEADEWPRQGVPKAPVA